MFPTLLILHIILTCVLRYVSDYDLCTSCINSGSAEAHNPFHEFFEIEEPGRVIVHTVFSGNGERNAASRNGRHDGSTPHMYDNAAPATAEPVPHNATCDLCDSRIYGDRYKCVSCPGMSSAPCGFFLILIISCFPDFDTCSSCFAITNEQHPGHGFVKVANAGDVMVRS